MSVITLSGVGVGAVDLPSPVITVTLDVAAPGGGTSVALSVASLAGAFATSPVVIAEGGFTGSFTFTPSALGTGVISASSSGFATGTLSFDSVVAVAATPAALMMCGF
jgi:hypothetical protein